jgi:membrane protein implicated in regulation of membrane protease activity
MMNCSVWLLISKVLNAATVTSVMVLTSASVSFLITIAGFMEVSFLLLANGWRFTRATKRSGAASGASAD